MSGIAAFIDNGLPFGNLGEGGRICFFRQTLYQFAIKDQVLRFGIVIPACAGMTILVGYTLLLTATWYWLLLVLMGALSLEWLLRKVRQLT